MGAKEFANSLIHGSTFKNKVADSRYKHKMGHVPCFENSTIWAGFLFQKQSFAVRECVRCAEQVDGLVLERKIIIILCRCMFHVMRLSF